MTKFPLQPLIHHSYAGVVNDLIAMYVMGWHLVNVSYKTPTDHDLDQWLDLSGHLQQWHVSYDPSTNIQYTPAIIERLSGRFSLFIEIHESMVYAKFVNPKTQESFGTRAPLSRLPFAICIIALKAVGHFIDQIPEGNK